MKSKFPRLSFLTKERKNKKRRKNDQSGTQAISQLEISISENLQTVREEDLNLLENKKNKLNEIRKHKIEGVMIRSRCRYEDLGEKPSSYFLNFEKRKFPYKVITKIIEDNGQESLSTEEILNSQKHILKACIVKIF